MNLDYGRATIAQAFRFMLYYSVRYIASNDSKSFVHGSHLVLCFHAYRSKKHQFCNQWLVVFNVSSTVRSFGDGTTIYCPLQRT